MDSQISTSNIFHSTNFDGFCSTNIWHPAVQLLVYSATISRPAGTAVGGLSALQKRGWSETHGGDQASGGS